MRKVLLQVHPPGPVSTKTPQNAPRGTGHWTGSNTFSKKEGNLAGRPLLPNIILISIYFSHNKLKAIHADVTLCIHIGQYEVETVDTLID